jgi:CHAT domain/Leucine Rich repeat
MALHLINPIPSWSKGRSLLCFLFCSWIFPPCSQPLSSFCSDIVNSGAIGSFIAIAANHEGKLRSMAIEAIRVLSEDTSPNRRTRSQLCEEGAAMALGRALKDGVTGLHNAMKPSRESIGLGGGLSIDELHDALCALANILEPVQPGNSGTTKLRFVPSNSDPTQNLIQGCIETAESGGLDSLLWISSLPLTGAAFSNSTELTVQRVDLLEEACRSLASLSPLLLSKEPAGQGYARCADSIFEAFDRILMMDSMDFGENSSYASEEQYEHEAMLELNISALRGLGALATAEPLKIKIVDKTLPCLLQMRNSQGMRSDVSNGVGQVFLSLGFEEDEIAVQVAGSNPNLLADWFCLQRSLVIQAMARSEIRRMLLHIWKVPFAETKKDGVTRLIRETNVRRTAEDKVSFDSFAESFAEVDLFESFADDDYTEQVRHLMVRQYHEFYNMGTPARSTFDVATIENDQDEVSLLSRHMYPLNDTQTEIDWILGHDESIYSKTKGEPGIYVKVSAPAHVEALLDCCFPSRLLRNHLVPVFNLRPEATFNFRALTMPQRKYFSFRREGQLISRLCDKQAEALDFDDVHWTLGFMNSTFAGEFSETLVQALYLCPTIRGLSFGKNEDYARLRALDGDDEQSDDGSASLSNLVGSLPPWIHSLTFSNIFNDREVKTLVGIMETMGKLSSDQAAKASSMGGYGARGRDSSSSAQAQGKFFSFAICSSPRVSPEVWHSFFSLLGRANILPQKAASSPLSSLKVLDLSFNNLGDETCSLLLELIHDPESGCSLEQLDLSGNGIRNGARMISVLRRYVEHHRFNVSSGSKNDGSDWQSSLRNLNLSANNLGAGTAAVDIVALLNHNALALKVLDLSSNGFESSNVEYELIHALLASMEHNTVLVHLNLSNNNFSPDLLDELLSQLAETESECGIAFLGLDNITPPLSVLQESCLERFLHKCRRFVLQKSLNERDSALSSDMLRSGTLLEPDPNNLGYQKLSDLSIIGESTVLANQESYFKSTFDDAELQPGENMITVLFSAPLVFTNERRQLKPFAKLDFDMERELMWQCMKEASRDIELFFDNATHDRLLAAITKRCSCLHYSGHGHPSYLPFEDGGGGPNWFKVEDIQRLIAREGAAPFKFVFVSACHSGLAGETFASAGVPHVVCCQQEFELKDTAALAFTRQFYLSLVIGHTVRESFEQGCKAVRATPNLRDSEKEMKKFLLLPKDGNHDVPIFNAKAVLEWPKVSARQLRSRSSKRPKSITRIRNLHVGGARSSELGVRNMMQEDPSPTPPQFFLGREVEMYYVLKAILCKRLVSVVAEPGLGRSSLVCALCHYINERASTIIAIERIYFVKAKRSRRFDGCRALMEQLLRKLVESGKEDPPDPGVDMEDLFDFICKALKNEKALVVFDRMEYLENSDDAEEFPMLLSTLFRGTKNVKVLVTGSHPLGIPSLGGQVEYPFPLGPLTFENTLRLFANLCPHLHTAGERHKLFERLATDGEQSELRPGDSGISDRTKAIFKTIGDGIPSRIEQAAYDISSDNLRELLDRYG